MNYRVSVFQNTFVLSRIGTVHYHYAIVREQDGFNANSEGMVGEAGRFHREVHRRRHVWTAKLKLLRRI